MDAGFWAAVASGAAVAWLCADDKKKKAKPQPKESDGLILGPTEEELEDMRAAERAEDK